MAYRLRFPVPPPRGMMAAHSKYAIQDQGRTNGDKTMSSRRSARGEVGGRPVGGG